jgi:hypothetical protein
MNYRLVRRASNKSLQRTRTSGAVEGEEREGPRFVTLRGVDPATLRYSATDNWQQTAFPVGGLCLNSRQHLSKGVPMILRQSFDHSAMLMAGSAQDKAQDRSLPSLDKAWNVFS